MGWPSVRKPKNTDRQRYSKPLKSKVGSEWLHIIPHYEDVSFIGYVWISMGLGADDLNNYSAPYKRKENVMSVSTNTPITQTIDMGSIYQAVKQDFQNIGTALQSGSLSNTQQSFAQLLQDKQSLNQVQGTSQSQGHHHHHHHASGNKQANAGQASQTSSSQAVMSSAITGVSQSQNSTSTT